MAATKEIELKLPENEDAELDAALEKSNELAAAAAKEAAAAAKKAAKEAAAQKAAENRAADMTTAVPRKQEKYKGAMVSVFLPELENSGSEGLKVDQYEHVTIANEQKEEIWHVRRGENVLVPVPVFMVLKEKYPKI